MGLLGGSVLFSLIDVVTMILTLYLWIVVIAALITWVNPDPYNPIVRFLRQATEPVFHRVRRLLPFAAQGGIDFTPMIVVFIIIFLRLMLARIAMGLAF